MIDIKRRKKFLNVRELLFAGPGAVAPAGEDLQYFVQAAAAGRGSQPFHTLLLELGEDEAALLAKIRKGFVYEIRRARERDLVVPLVFAAPDGRDIARFCEFFDTFAAAKALGAANHAKLRLLADANALVLAASVQQGRPERWFSAHAYICDGARARLLYSAGDVGLDGAEERKLLGRANKLLHWGMVQYFKACGFSHYDFGGISKSAALRALDDFKEGFGGQERIEYNRMLGVTILGKLCVWGVAGLASLRSVRQALKQAKNAYPVPPPPPPPSP